MAKQINYTTPGKPMSEYEMLRMLKEAENGRFYSMKELRKMIANWKRTHAAKIYDL